MPLWPTRCPDWYGERRFIDNSRSLALVVPGLSQTAANSQMKPEKKNTKAALWSFVGKNMQNETKESTQLQTYEELRLESLRWIWGTGITTDHQVSVSSFATAATVKALPAAPLQSPAPTGWTFGPQGRNTSISRERFGCHVTFCNCQGQLLRFHLSVDYCILSLFHIFQWQDQASGPFGIMWTMYWAQLAWFDITPVPAVLPHLEEPSAWQLGGNQLPGSNSSTKNHDANIPAQYWAQLYVCIFTYDLYIPIPYSQQMDDETMSARLQGQHTHIWFQAEKWKKTSQTFSCKPRTEEKANVLCREPLQGLTRVRPAMLWVEWGRAAGCDRGMLQLQYQALKSNNANWANPKAVAWLLFPTVQSKTVCFFSCSSMIFSSMVSALAMSHERSWKIMGNERMKVRKPSLPRLRSAMPSLVWLDQYGGHLGDTQIFYGTVLGIRTCLELVRWCKVLHGVHSNS